MPQHMLVDGVVLVAVVEKLIFPAHDEGLHERVVLRQDIHQAVHQVHHHTALYKHRRDKITGNVLPKGQQNRAHRIEILGVSLINIIFSDARGKPVNLPNDRLTVNVLKNRLTDKKVFIIEIESKISKIFKRSQRCDVMSVITIDRE